MRGIFLLGVILLLMYWGFRKPIIFVLAYVWASIFTPQHVAYSIITSIPISLIFGLAAFVAFLKLQKVPYIRWRSQSVLTGALAIWMTLTLLWAVVPEYAFVKWDWAIKSIAFTVIIPHFIRDRQDLEAFLWTVVAGGMAHCIPFGAKVVLSGGGYGMPLGLVSGNSGYGEGSTLAMFSVSLIPMCIYLYIHQTLIPHLRLTKLMLGIFIVFLLLTSIGTYARTGVVCMVALGACLIYYGKRRILSVVLVMILVGVAFPFIEVDWLERMSSINNDSETSAMGRVAVWMWVIEYVASHPWGGSFDMYRINVFSMNLPDGTFLQITSKAFHSIYFEMLGEGGVPGLLLYISLILTTLLAFVRHAKIFRLTGELWLSDAARYLLITTLIFLAGGAFIGIAFQSYFYYLAALAAVVANLTAKHAPNG